MKSPAFQFYAQDFLVGTMLMSPEAIGVYIRFLAYEWVNGFVPSDRSLCARIISATDAAIEEALQKFERGEDGNWRNPKLEKVRAEQLANREKNLKNGRKGGRPKTQTEPKENPNETQTVTQSEPLQSSTSSSKDIPSASADGIEFAEWFRESLPSDCKLTESWKQDWGRCFDEMIRLDGRNSANIYDVCEWGRKDNFWSRNFQSPLKLRKKNRDGVCYFDAIRSNMPRLSTGTPGTIGNSFL